MENPNEPIDPQPEPENETPEVQIDPDRLERYREQLKMDQNLPMGILASFAACLIGAILWAAVTVITKYQIGYMALAVGFLVGIANRYFGKGIDMSFGIVGGIFALLGCVLGNLFSIAEFASEEYGLSIWVTLQSLLANFSLLVDVFTSSFSVMDVLFYAIAVYEGYRFSFRNITEEEILENASATTY